MPGPKPITITLSDRQQEILERIVKRHQTPQQLGKRVKLILWMALGKNNQQAADLVGVHQETALMMARPLARRSWNFDSSRNEWDGRKRTGKIESRLIK